MNQTIVEEVLQDLGVLDFGKGMTAEFNVSIWRERGTHHPLCGALLGGVIGGLAADGFDLPCYVALS